jgi:hypothetical protein
MMVATEHGEKIEECECCGKEHSHNDTYSCCYCGITISDCCGTGFACYPCEEAGGYSGDDSD